MLFSTGCKMMIVKMKSRSILNNILLSTRKSRPRLLSIQFFSLFLIEETLAIIVLLWYVIFR